MGQAHGSDDDRATQNRGKHNRPTWRQAVVNSTHTRRWGKTRGTGNNKWCIRTGVPGYAKTMHLAGDRDSHRYTWAQASKRGSKHPARSGA